MSARDILGRRGFIGLGLGAGLACSLGRIAAAEETVCTKSYAGDKEQRDSLHYTEKSVDPAKTCEQCQYFESRGSCGNCRIFHTLVNPAGSCDSWSKKVD